MVWTVQGSSAGSRFDGAGQAGQDGVIPQKDATEFRALANAQQAPAGPPVRLAQTAVPMPGVPFAPPLPPMAIPGTPENKAATDPIARGMVNAYNRLPNLGQVGRRLGYLGHELGQGHVGVLWDTTTHGYPAHVDFPENEAGAAQGPNGGRPNAGSFPAHQPGTPPLTAPIPEQEKGGAIGGGFAFPDMKRPQEGFAVPSDPVNTTILESRSRKGEPDIPGTDATGKVHGKLPDRTDSWTPEQKQEASDALERSIRRREQEQQVLGEESKHRKRIEEERDLKRRLDKDLSGS